MGDDRSGSELPGGWNKEERLIGAGKFGEVWTVCRHDGHGLEIRRVARLLPIAGRTNLRDQLVSRLSKLSNLALPHVSLPDGVWQADDDCLVIFGPCHDKPLEALLTEDRGLGAELEPLEYWARWAASYVGFDAGNARAERLLEQLLAGLAGLHAHGISHGDIRPRNIFMDDLGSSGENAWLADAAIGPLARWSEGSMRDPDSSHYHPPEWNGTARDPSFQADLFALGLTYCEAALGRDANPVREEGNRTFSKADRKRLLAQLGQHGVSRRARTVIAKLLEPAPEARPSTAKEALELWLRQNSPSLWGLLPWGVAAGLLLLLMLAWRGWGVETREVADLSERGQKLEANISTLVAERDDYKGQLDQMTGVRQQMTDVAAVLKRIEQRIDDGDTNATTASDKAKMRWQESYDSLSGSINPSALALCELQIQTIENLFKEPTSDLSPDERSLLKNWLNSLKGLRDTSGARAWAKHDAKFQELLKHAVKQPWDDSDDQGNVKSAGARIKVLNDAYKKWLAWAADEKMTREELERQILLVPNEDERKAILQWRDDMMTSANVTMELDSGKSDDWGTTQRNVYVYGSQKSQSGWHQWTANTSHTYPSTGKAPDTVDFQWQPGEPLRIVLEAGRAWNRGGTYHPNLIDQQFNGPLAVWQANRIGQIQSGIRRLKFEIKNCPGPPRPKRP